MKYLPLLAVILFLAGCAETPFLYYGKTSQCYYRSVKNPGINTSEAYRNSLEDVFTRSAEKGLPVPPGLYCDYALLLAREGDYQNAQVYLQKEKALYLESAPLVDFLSERFGLQH